MERAIVYQSGREHLQIQYPGSYLRSELSGRPCGHGAALETVP